jgi:hypothetical protein
MSFATNSTRKMAQMIHPAAESTAEVVGLSLTVSSKPTRRAKTTPSHAIRGSARSVTRRTQSSKSSSERSRRFVIDREPARGFRWL